jgi:hypothetical protein
VTLKSLAVGLFLGVALCSLPECRLTHEVVEAPPAGDPAGTSAWWADRADRLDPGLRAVYVAAADAHRSRGTSATYVNRHAFRTMMGGVDTELRLPCPPPPDALALLRERVRPGDSTRGAGLFGHVRAEAGVGCSAEDADRIWREAIETARKADGPVPPN